MNKPYRKEEKKYKLVSGSDITSFIVLTHNQNNAKKPYAKKNLTNKMSNLLCESSQKQSQNLLQRNHAQKLQELIEDS
jgi:hypothetical protein